MPEISRDQDAAEGLDDVVRTMQAAAPPWLGKLIATVGPAAAIIAFQTIFYRADWGFILHGATIGLFTALLAVGMALIYRTNRVLNFSQADLGFVPALLGVLMITASGINYYVGFLAGLGTAIVGGAIIEFFIIQRFFRAPRLILTVATIGLSQLLAALAFFLFRAWDTQAISRKPEFPWEFSFTVDPLVFHSEYVVAWIVGPIAMLAVALFLGATPIGTAIRAAADSADRAGLLGVPVRQLHTIVWSVAATLAFIGIWLQAGVIGIPLGTALALTVLLRALAALTLGNLTNLPAIALSAVALGILETAVVRQETSTAESGAVLGAVIIIALLVRSILTRSDSRADSDTTSTWQAAEEVRPVPPELRRVREVQVVRGLVAAIVVVATLTVPHLLGTADLNLATLVVVFAIIGVSVIVLTGWAGQVSLGQMAFVAYGAAVVAKLTHEWNVDLLLALLAASVVGAGVAVVIGLPALRQRGLFLAVTSLAFALATTEFLLNENFWVGSWTYDSRFDRAPLLGRIDIETPTRMYYIALAGLGLVLLMMRGVRRTRTGRVLVALRENEQATQAFGISPVRAKLTGFALSGAIAAFAGGLYAYVQHRFLTGDGTPYAPGASIEVFTLGVIGGLGSLAGGLFGALYLRGLDWFLPGQWVLLASGIGVLFVLWVFPSGIGGVFFRLRDMWLRWVARRHHLIVPSLLADVAPTAEEEAEVLGTEASEPESEPDAEREAAVGGPS